MHLYLFRHGIAEDLGPDGGDASRRLTDEGVSKTRRAAEGLREMGVSPGALLTSPLIRAQQTAAIAADVLGLTPDVLPELASGPAERVLTALRDWAAKPHAGPSQAAGDVMLVGHEPTLSAMIELLTAGRSRGAVHLKKAGCGCVQAPSLSNLTPGSAMLAWLATPKMLRGLA